MPTVLPLLPSAPRHTANSSFYEPSPNASVNSRAYTIGGPTLQCGDVVGCIALRYTDLLGVPIGQPLIQNSYDLFTRPWYQIGLRNGAHCPARTIGWDEGWRNGVGPTGRRCV